ncbi:MAG TPA: GNAT family N-acetyltransferase [Vicinamibacterales bacterium]|jgi:ribosomal protein S18 acetylase RimI-like enzyme
MPALTDKHAIRALLQRDRRWGVYALGDLTPRMFEKCQWFTPDLTLVLHDYGTSILFAMGTASICEALGHVAWPVHLQVRPEALDEVARHATVTSVKQMWRMAWTGGSVAPPDRAIRLRSQDAAAIEALYRDGESTGESPDFFYSSMVTDGVFFGIYEGSELVAAAGTHLVSRDEGAAAIGNVYVRRDRRSRGLGRMVTAAVLHELREVETIGLNVRADNASAIRVYESLGFVKHCEFREALATSRLG